MFFRWERGWWWVCFDEPEDEDSWERIDIPPSEYFQRMGTPSPICPKCKMRIAKLARNSRKRWVCPCGRSFLSPLVNRGPQRLSY